MDGSVDAPEDGSFPEIPASDFLHEVEPGSQEGLKPEAEHAHGGQGEQDERETDPGREETSVHTPLPFPEERVPDLSQENTFFKPKNWNGEMDLQGWMEKINNIIQKINVTESTVKRTPGSPVADFDEKPPLMVLDLDIFTDLELLLNEVISLEDQIESLESHQDRDSDQGANMEGKIMKIKTQLGDMDHKFAKAEACNEAHELKEKLIERMENFCKDVTLVNTKMGKYQMQEGKADSHSPEEKGIEEAQPLLPQSPPPPLVDNTSCVMLWKRALSISVLFCVLTFAGLSCYVLFFDPTFIFERMLPRLLGRQTMWELREIIAPFLSLEVEDLLPS